jgi:hypothetical protein
MIAYIVAFALALVAGWSWARRHKGVNVVRLAPRSPFPPYDWFAHESPLEEPYSPSDEKGHEGPLSA